MPSFDLRDEPWVPVRLDGRTRWVGLRELFLKAHLMEDLEVPVPPAASGLLRILYAMAARIAADDKGERLDDGDLAEEPAEWFGTRKRILAQGRFDPTAVEDYFDRAVPPGRFDLFDPARPFLQDPRLVNECTDARGKASPSGVNKLVMGRPTGVNGAVLFGHFNDGDPAPIPTAEAVWHMIAQLFYGPSGQCTPRRITAVKPGNGDAGPLRKTISYHPWASDLFTSLILGIPRWQDTEDPEADSCPWEADELPAPLDPLPAITWPGRLLTGRARHAVLLVPSEDGASVTDAYLTWSTHEAASAAHDPYVVLKRSKEGNLFSGAADTARAVWRDIDALLLKSRPQGDVRRPRIFDDVSEIPRSVLRPLRVRAYGFHQDGQQKDVGWYAATTPPVLRWLEEAEPEMALRISACHRAAEEIGSALAYATWVVWAESTGSSDRKDKGSWAARAATTYWAGAEALFWKLTSPDTQQRLPHQPLAQLAQESLELAVGRASADIRVARALAHARHVIRKAVPAVPQPTAT